MTDPSDKPSRPAVPDAYEASIAAPGEVLHRDKQVSRLLAWICLLMMLFAFLGAAGGLAQGAPIAAAVGVGAVGLLFLFLGLTRSVLRTVVTAADIRIQWGLWGPRIELSAVKAVSVRQDYGRQALIAAMREPGSPGIEMIALPVRGPVLDLTWSDETGRARRAWMGAGDANALCAAIQRAMAAKAATGSRIAGATEEHIAAVATAEGDEINDDGEAEAPAQGEAAR